MPQSSNEQSSFGAWPGFLVTLLLVVGAGLVQAPFRPDRPDESKAGMPWVGMQDVDARLWQDPFAAVAARKEQPGSGENQAAAKAAEVEGRGKARGDKTAKADAPRPTGAGATRPAPLPQGTGNEQKPPPATVNQAAGESDGGPGRAAAHNLKWLAERLHTRQAQVNGDIKVLAVMVSGGPSIGAAEARRRTRYAVLSGLMLEGFLPDDPQHVGYVDLGAEDAPPDYVPFEWFYTDKTDKKADGADRGPAQALLLWVDEDGLTRPLKDPAEPALDTCNAQQTPPAAVPGSPRPLCRLSGILTKLLTAAAAPPDKISFRVIGPGNSTTLQFITEELRALGAGTCVGDADMGKGTMAPMWSPFVTIPPNPTKVTQTRTAVCTCSSSTDCIAISAPSKDTRTIADDRTLVALLVGELHSRHVMCDAGVALVGQWDTAYSRSLADLFRRVWTDVDAQACDGAATRPPFEFSYMRGLDGAIPGAQHKDPTKDSSKDSTKDQAKGIERPEGDTQFDYLRRMRDALGAEDTRLRATCDLHDRFKQRCGIRAIGVLGDDYYDKLLVLQALKRVFPDAVFFTTDLTAAMLHPRDNELTRNLIVASGFGLTLRSNLQGVVPPLRDSYQTSVLLAVRLALDSPAAKGLDDKLPLPPPARLFEIGRTRAVEMVAHPSLKVGDDFRRPKPTAPTEGVDPGNDPHPDEALNADFRLFAADSNPVFGWAISLTALLAAILAALTLGPVFMRRIAPAWRAESIGSWLPIVGVGVFTLVALSAIAFFAREDLHAGGEPFSLAEGVSVWPSEFLRLFAGLAALTFLILGHARLRREREKIGAEFRLTGAHRETESSRANDRAQSPGQTPGADPNIATAGHPPEASADKVEGVAPVRCAQLLRAPAAGRHADAAGREEEQQRTLRAQDIWDCYLAGCHALWKIVTPRKEWEKLPEHDTRWSSWSIAARVTIEMLLFFAVAAALMVAFGFPNHPVRSDLALHIDLAVIWLVLIPFLLLLFYMVDATRQTMELARKLADPVRWPNRTLALHGLDRWAGDGADEATTDNDIDWLDVRLIASVTRPVGNLVWYPVLVLIIIAVARHPQFDAWTLPPALLIVMLVTILYAVGCAWVLRKAAERVRETALRNLSAARLRAQGQGGMEVCIAQLDTMLSAVKAECEGAFRPFSQQPVVQALLALVSSISGLALVQYASMVNL